MKILAAWIAHPIRCARGVRWHRLCERLRVAMRKRGTSDEDMKTYSDAVIARRVGELAAVACGGVKNPRRVERAAWEILRGWVDEIEAMNRGRK